MAERPLRVACIQVNAGADMAVNLAALRPLLDWAAATGAELIVTPENAVMLATGRRRSMARAYPHERHPAIPWFAEAARARGIWLMAGSLAVTVEDGARLANRCHLFAPDGALVASYDKIHMFDVDLPGGDAFRESRTYRPGDGAVATRIAGGWGLGLTICYDVRFPHLYRGLAQAGAELITVPSAFTDQTGEAHWHLLLRARAVETGCFIAAPAQTGLHDRGRQTYGHSLIVAPWGEVLAEAGRAPGVIAADLDPAAIAAARRAVPAIHGDRSYSTPRAL